MERAIITVLLAASLTLAIPPHNPPVQSGDHLLNSTDSARNATDVVNGTYSLPMFDSDPAARAAEIASDREGYVYGPSLLGNSSFFLYGTKGTQLVQRDVGLWTRDATPQRKTVIVEKDLAQQAVEKVRIKVLLFGQDMNTI